MKSESPILASPGEPCSLSEFRTQKGVQFAEYLQRMGKNAFVELREWRRRNEPSADIVVFDIAPERSQELVHPIQATEAIAVVFGEQDIAPPEVLALRGDFPAVSHVNQRNEEFPRSLCMYDQAWVDEKPSWTPASFLKRIHVWLSKTAVGTLHAGDQPLEPLIFNPLFHLVVPPDFEQKVCKDKACQLEIFNFVEHAHQSTILSRWPNPENKNSACFACANFVCSPQPHGVIRRTPISLKDLHEICLGGEFQLLEELQNLIKAWLLNPPFANYITTKLIIVIVLPKTRIKGGEIEQIETRAFLTTKTVKEIGVELGVFDCKSDVSNGAPGTLLFPEKLNPEKFAEFSITPMGVHKFLDTTTATIMNGCAPSAIKTMAIGAGAFGSQAINNLTRTGMPPFSIVDHDILMPHNCARHFLTAVCIGQNKAKALAAYLSESIHFFGEPMRGIPADVLNPCEHREALNKAKEKADVIFDFSASVVVARNIGREAGKARRMSGFVTPSGNGMVMLLEDTVRNFRLDWLEALHYRAILDNPSLKDSLKRSEGSIRTGGSCRDISLFIAQADMAMWAGAFSKHALSLLKNETAAVKVFQQTEDGKVDVISVMPENLTTALLGEWKIVLDQWLLQKLSNFREKRLPNETGGVLLGIIDTEAKQCAIVDALPSPPDSIEWPDSYIRGCCNLYSEVKAAEQATAGYVTYIGEWHSHPQGHSTKASQLDIQAYAILKQQRDVESLPTLMLVIGDDLQWALIHIDNIEIKNDEQMEYL